MQPKLSLKVSQRQVLTPGLVQMVSVLALNKLELKDMINSEMVENPVLEELEESNATLEERAGIEGDRERSAEEMAVEAKREERKIRSMRSTSAATFRTILIPASRRPRTLKITTSLRSNISWRSQVR